MEQSVIFSGFGGQGALFVGQVLAYAAMDVGLEVTWIPSYGPEMRGGTAHCTVILADEPIGSPLVRQPAMVVALNLPSTDKYEPLIAPGGVFVIDSTVVKRPIVRSDITAVAIPASEIAIRHGDVRLANMAMLGALIAIQEVVPLGMIESALRKHIPERHERLLDANLAALREGMAAALDLRSGQRKDGPG
jgi:2-oxoglutarate ferredoxin oxidoreductase subunit gamma